MKMRSKFALLIVFLTSLSSGLMAQALPDLGSIRPPAPLDPELEKRREDALKERQRAVEDFKPRGDQKLDKDRQAADAFCFDISNITLDGVSVFTPEEIAELLKKYAPSCMDGSAIQSLMQEIDGMYAEKGYITSKTYIPPQNIASGQLQLSVVEGHVEAVVLLDKDGVKEDRRARWQLKTAFPNVEGDIFQLRDFEQGLDQINRLKSVEAKMRLQPGNEVGGSHVLVQRLQEDRFRLYVDTDNMGQESTGRYGLGLTMEIDDLVGANDAWVASVSSTENSNDISIRPELPYGYWTFSGSYAYSEYNIGLTEIAELFGNSYSGTLGLKYMFDRDEFSTTELMADLYIRRSERSINGVELAPQDLTTLSLGARRIWQKNAAKYSVDGALVFGLGLFGGDENPKESDAPHSRFVKLEFGGYRQAPLGSLGVLVSDLRAQLAFSPLVGAEQMVLGSRSTVRAYNESEAYGDLGAYLRNDLYLDTAQFGGWYTETPVLKDFSPSLFADFGVTYDRAFKDYGKAAGIGLGLNYEYKNMSANLSLGAPLIKDNEFGLDDFIAEFGLSIKLM